MKLKTITTSKAISKVKTVIQIAFAVLFCIGFSCLYLLTAKVHYVWVGLILFASIVFFKVFQSMYVLKWKIWAFQHVDDIAELFARSKSENITSGLFAGKWTVGTASDKAKLAEIIRHRLHHDDKREFDRDSVPDSMNITGSKKENFIGFIGCLGIIFLPLKRIITHTSNHPENDYGMIIIISLLATHLLLKTITPNSKISLSRHGLWTKRNGFQKWDAVKDAYITNMVELEASENYLVIEFNSKKTADSILKLKVKSLNKSADEIEKALKVYRKHSASRK